MQAVTGSSPVISTTFTLSRRLRFKQARNHLDLAPTCQIELARTNWDRLVGADLTGADLTGVVLRFTDFRRANLTGADLDQCRDLPSIYRLRDPPPRILLFCSTPSKAPDLAAAGRYFENCHA